MCTDGWVAIWASSSSSSSTSAGLPLFLGIYAFWVVLSSLLACVQQFVSWHAELSAASKLHNSMLHAVLASPVSFFDTNPRERLHNAVIRFSVRVVHQMCLQRVPTHTLIE